MKAKFVPLPGPTLAKNFTQRCRSKDYCPCRRIILCVEDLPGIGSSSHLRATTPQNNSFSEATQTDTSDTVNCCFLTMHTHTHKALNLTVKLAPQ
ncbi:hypothetical protein TNIN_393681 [Trichonephila inaurata madagascariensis]|uniref:Uncharacterized protein n=1 Tax=Trichonephila inaurata madagascariensis TaxID=2747483 RepID=A0A8X6MBZ5_9ARAC|nr:hypothetical protein TNIN_393681 [Trichonephila inaurata madagascariensis]